MCEPQIAADATKTSEARIPLHVFPAPLIVSPLKRPHRQTVIFLHGRGSSARIFASPFLAAPVQTSLKEWDDEDTEPASLQRALPHTRFVFPTAPRSRATVYRRSIINQWYDGSGDWEETVLGHARETVDFLHGLLEEEASLLGGASRVVLGGFSQGCAAALLCLLLWQGEPLGGVVGMCGMLPMGGALGDILFGPDVYCNDSGPRDLAGQDVAEDNISTLASDEASDLFDCGERRSSSTPISQALNVLREEIGLQRLDTHSETPFRHTPVFLGHGTEDNSVPICYGLDASRVLQMLQCDVEFMTYPGVGHSYSKEMLSDVIHFLHQKVPCFARFQHNE